MSYILDALRKADAQRERDPARGIHAQPAPAVPVPGGAATRGVWLAAAAILAAGVAWIAWNQRVAPPIESVAAAPVAAPSPPPVVVTVATTVTPPAPAPLPAPPVVRATEPVVAKAEAPAAAAAPDRVFAIAELPADVQRELPRLAISGGVHSRNAAQRLLVVGGQVVNEGAELAPGVVLEQIRARTAVLRFRGYRYSLPY